MKKGGGISDLNGNQGKQTGGQDLVKNKKKMKRNMQRLGGRGGLSLESFANAKTRNENYNPSLIKWAEIMWHSTSATGFSEARKFERTLLVQHTVSAALRRAEEKQREFYKNAKYIQKYKRSLKQQEQLDNHSTDERPLELEGDNETKEGGYVNRNKKGKKNAWSLGELYEKKRQEKEKARVEREAAIQAKKEERERTEARRRDLKDKMSKKTKSGQPVMKYRIEHLLETIQGPTS
ncbi:hypothetical protein OROHE_025749 [Orobanche hederae]